MARRTTENAGEVLRGLSRRVVVVRPPGPVFEEAIFILREDYGLSPALSRKELLREAERAAGFYAAAVTKRRRFSPYACICRVISRLRRTMMRFSNRLI